MHILGIAGVPSPGTTTPQNRRDKTWNCVGRKDKADKKLCHCPSLDRNCLNSVSLALWLLRAWEMLRIVRRTVVGKFGEVGSPFSLRFFLFPLLLASLDPDMPPLSWPSEPSVFPRIDSCHLTVIFVESLVSFLLTAYLDQAEECLTLSTFSTPPRSKEKGAVAGASNPSPCTMQYWPLAGQTATCPFCCETAISVVMPASIVPFLLFLIRPSCKCPPLL
jgi:hypothetical protein